MDEINRKIHNILYGFIYNNYYKDEKIVICEKENGRMVRLSDGTVVFENNYGPGKLENNHLSILREGKWIDYLDKVHEKLQDEYEAKQRLKFEPIDDSKVFDV